MGYPNTDNTNRTLASIRFIFGKYNGALGPNGSLTFLFDRKGVFSINTEDVPGKDMESLELELIDAGAEDIEIDEEVITVTCAKDDFGSVNRKLEELGIEPDEAMLKRVPKEGDRIVWAGWRFEVVDMDGRRIDKVLASREDAVA